MPYGVIREEYREKKPWVPKILNQNVYITEKL